MVVQALQAADRLAEDGIDVTVVDMHTVKPLDEACLLEHCAGKRFVVSAEDHQINGGLGSAVAELLAEQCLVPMKRIGVRDTFAESGPYPELLTKYGLDAGAIERAVRDGLAAAR
jgi:transketolase